MINAYWIFTILSNIYDGAFQEEALSAADPLLLEAKVICSI